MYYVKLVYLCILDFRQCDSYKAPTYYEIVHFVPRAEKWLFAGPI